MYFHALASTKEFAVSTKFLRNQTLATDPANYYEFKVISTLRLLGNNLKIIIFLACRRTWR